MKTSGITFASALQRGITRLAASSPSARLDAEVLLATAGGFTRSHLRTHAEQTIDGPTAARFDKWLDQRAAGMPVAYLVGRKEFWSLELEVTPAVLIPRPETELLVEKALEWLPVTPSRMLDLGTGSGAIALAVASERLQAQVVATDRSAAALTIARQNAGRLQLKNIAFLEGDWYQPLGKQRFDVIVSNPPYIGANDPALLASELRTEPWEALTPGVNGLEAIETIASKACMHLHPGGWLGVEHGADQGHAVRSLFSRCGFKAVQSSRDLAGHERITYGQA